MATIVTRAGKGAALTFEEGDANFNNLNDDKIEAVQDDTAPVLGGDLDVGTNAITTTEEDGDIVLRPDGLGLVRAECEGIMVGLGEEQAGIVTPDNTSDLLLATNDGEDTASIIVRAGTNGKIEIDANGTGKVEISGIAYPNADGTTGQVLTTNGSGVLSFSTVSAGGISAVEDDTAPVLGGDLDVNGFAITSAAELEFTVADNPDRGIQIAERNISPDPENPVLVTFIEPVGDETKLAVFADSLGIIGQDEIRMISQSVNINGLIYPAEDGDAGDVLTTDGEGNLVFAAVQGSGISAVEDDTAPKLGGNLDVSTFSIVSTDDGDVTIAPDGVGKSQIKNITYNEVLFLINDGDPVSGTLTIDAANGSIQYVDIDGNITINGFANPVTGQTVRLIVESDDQYTLTAGANVFFAGGNKTLTNAGTDIITIFYTGQDYLAKLDLDFQ